MRRQIKILSVAIFVGIAAAASVLAQQGDNEFQEHRFAQLTFFTPIGSNGTNSQVISSNLSINLLYGVTGGVYGFELGGLHNTTKGDVNGVQMAGLGSVTMGNFKGVQFSGLYNVDFGLTRGVQFAGLSNVIYGPSRGVHFAGLSNVVKKESWAVQAAGLTNIAPKGNHGVQLAGLTNINGDEGEGPQFSGLVNVNMARISTFQAAGLVNVATQEVHGAQLAGLVNYTKRLNGFQMALINVADTVEKGVPLGLFSVVKHGYYAFEIEANDAFWFNATYKMGVPRLYNIWTLGFRQQDGHESWSVGLGLGSLVTMGEKWGLNFDLTASQINEGEWWTDDLNLLNRLKINAWYDLGKLKVFGGPSLNVHVSKLENKDGLPGGNLVDPNVSFYQGIHGITKTTVYPGFNLGIRF